jgi:hypothetical protein
VSLNLDDGQSKAGSKHNILQWISPNRLLDSMSNSWPKQVVSGRLSRKSFLF